MWRDVKVRYKQTVLGAAWAVLQPVLAMVVFTIFFGRLAGVPSDGHRYELFAFAALVPWTYFATAIGGGAQSLVGSQNLVSKVYFPRMIIPLAAVLTPLVDAAIAFMVLLGLMAWFAQAPTLAVLLLPAFALMALLTALAVSLWLSALNVLYRDVRYVVPFTIQIWLFASPVAYPASMVPEAWRPLYGLNPMAGVIEGFRWALLGAETPQLEVIGVSCAVLFVLLVGGVLFFRRIEAVFADVV